MKSATERTISFLRRADGAFRLKLRRLRFFRLASVNSETRRLAEGFGGLFTRDGDLYRIRVAAPGHAASNILRNMLGKNEEVEEILLADQELLSLDRDAFRAFLGDVIKNEAAAKNLYRIFFGFGVSLANLAAQRVPYLERYLPTTLRADAADFHEARFSGEDIVNIRHLIDNLDLITDNLEADTRLYREFIRDFRRLYREKAGLSIIGYGEISTVMKVEKGRYLDENFELKKIDSTKWIWKKMPPFTGLDEVREYDRVYREYREVLVHEVGIRVPAQMISYFPREGFVAVYAGQERADFSMIGNVLVKKLEEHEAGTLLLLVLWELLKVYQFNAAGGHILLGLDGQLSNWVLLPAEKGKLSHNDSLLYIDTSSPLYRVDGKEQLDTEIFIRNAPSFLRFFIRKFFLKEVVDRYYDMRSVIVDLIANLHKEKRPDLIKGFIEIANDFMREKGMSDRPITSREIDKYYSGDAFIWKFFQFSRRVDRFIIEKILRKKYHYRLPETIER